MKKNFIPVPLQKVISWFLRMEGGIGCRYIGTCLQMCSSHPHCSATAHLHDCSVMHTHTHTQASCMSMHSILVPQDQALSQHRSMTIHKMTFPTYKKFPIQACQSYPKRIQGIWQLQGHSHLHHVCPGSRYRKHTCDIISQVGCSYLQVCVCGCVIVKLMNEWKIEFLFFSRKKTNGYFVMMWQAEEFQPKELTNIKPSEHFHGLQITKLHVFWSLSLFVSFVYPYLSSWCVYLLIYLLIYLFIYLISYYYNNYIYHDHYYYYYKVTSTNLTKNIDHQCFTVYASFPVYINYIELHSSYIQKGHLPNYKLSSL